MDELPDVPALRVLEPPPGGLASLRERVAHRRSRWWWVVAPAAAALVIAALLFARATPMPAEARRAIRDRAIGEDFYWVSSAPARAERAEQPRVVAIDRVETVRELALP